MLKKHTRRNNAKSEVLTAVLIEIQIFRHMTSCRLVHNCRCFRETCCLFIKAYAGHEDGGSKLLRNVSEICDRQGISQKNWIWTKETIAILMRKYEGNIEIDPKICSRIGLNSPVMARYTIMNCLSAYKQQIPLLVQYQLSKVLVPLSL